MGAGASAFGAGASAFGPGFGPGRAPGFAAAGVPAGFAAGVLAAGLSVFSAFSAFGSGSTPSSASRFFRRRATGGAMDDAGLLTNSPISLSFSSATLLSMPSSEAISCTRGFATSLLSGPRAPGRSHGRQWSTGLISSRSSVVHSGFRSFVLGSVRIESCDLPDTRGVEGTRAKRSPKPRLALRDALRRRMHPRAPARKTASMIDDGDPLRRDDAHHSVWFVAHTAA